MLTWRWRLQYVDTKRVKGNIQWSVEKCARWAVMMSGVITEVVGAELQQHTLKWVRKIAIKKQLECRSHGPVMPLCKSALNEDKARLGCGPMG